MDEVDELEKVRQSAWTLLHGSDEQCEAQAEWRRLSLDEITAAGTYREAKNAFLRAPPEIRDQVVAVRRWLELCPTWAKINDVCVLTTAKTAARDLADAWSAFLSA